MATKTMNETAVVDDFEGDIDLTKFFDGKDFWAGHEDGAAAQDFTIPIPAGTYNAEVVEISKPVKSKSGNYMLKAQYRVTDAPYENRRVFQYISLMEKAKFQLTGTFAALGKTPGDTSYVPGEFNRMPCRVVLDVREATADYGASNSVKKVLSMADESSTTKKLW